MARLFVLVGPLGQLGSGCDGKHVEIAIEACQIATILVPAKHGVTQEFPHTGQFLPAAFPAGIADGEIEELQRAFKGLFT